jgi:benzylsuccinate CoA-transferase BbsE subunit
MEIKDESEGLLTSLRILDLADGKACFCSKLLADLGASVFKIEKPGGDPSRRIGPFCENTPSLEASLFFLHNNTNKWGITLDIEKSEGKEIFLRLLERTDVVVESFPPGYLESLGLGFNRLSEVNPRLIVVSVTGFGQDGPRSRYKSCDLVASAFGGQMYVSGSASTPPLKPHGEQSAYVASLFSAIAVLMALRQRNKIGKGAHIDISSQECVASTLDHVLVRYFYDGVISGRQGNVSWNGSSFICLCKDGYMHVTISTTQWETLVEWMAGEGMAEDLTDEAWKEEGYRQKHIVHLIDVVSRWTRTHCIRELFELGQAMRFPWAPVASPADVLINPQLRAREFFREIDHPERQATLGYPGAPYRITPSPRKRWKRAPLIGEDNLRLYHDELGFSEVEIERLSSLKVI